MKSIWGERLAGSKIIFHRKPSPNILGLGTVLDEDALRAAIAQDAEGGAGL